MFHQANLRQADVPEVPVNGVNRKLSLIQIWTEVVLQEMTRLYVALTPDIRALMLNLFTAQIGQSSPKSTMISVKPS
jgi:hypothetical protein